MKEFRVETRTYTPEELVEGLEYELKRISDKGWEIVSVSQQDVYRSPSIHILIVAQRDE